MLATPDEVFTRRPEQRHFWELRTARIITAEGHRYLNGVRDTFL